MSPAEITLVGSTPRKKSPYVIVRRALENLFGRTHLDHAPALHNSDAIADAQGLVQIMGNKNDGALMLLLELEQFVLHLRSNQRIESGKGLIH